MNIAPHTDAHRADVVSAVFTELDWAAGVDASLITITFRQGVLTLRGDLADEREHIAAREASMKPTGVRTLDDQLAVADSSDLRQALHDPANTEISQRVEKALEASGIPRRLLKAEVRDHIVTLTGRVDWGYERELARRCLEDLLGVRYVVNRLSLVRRPSPDITMGLIRDELASSTLLDADVIHVSILDSEITLTGIVQSEVEKKEAEHATWLSPHVSAVHNLLVVRPL